MLQVRAASGPLTSHKVSVRSAKPGDAVKVRLHLADSTEIFYLRLVYRLEAFMNWSFSVSASGTERT